MIGNLLRHPILTTLFVAKRIREIPSKGFPSLRSRKSSDDFDQKYGVDTAKIVQIVPTNCDNFIHGTRYSPSPENAVRWSIENCGMPLEDTTFVDIGAGKGRALIVALAYPFRKIVGIEYSSELARICRRNIDNVGDTDRCEVITQDAVEYDFPGGNLLVFLYNPFDAVVLRQVLTKLSMLEAKVRIAQLGPGHEVIRTCGFSRIICSGDGPTIYEIVGRSKNAHPESAL